MSLYWFRDRKRARRNRRRRDRRRYRRNTESNDTLSIEELHPEYQSVLPDGGAIHRMARQLFYSEEWDSETAHKPWIVRHMIDCVGVTEADIRDARRMVNYDAVEIRTHNHRRFIMDGMHEFTTHRKSMQ